MTESDPEAGDPWPDEPDEPDPEARWEDLEPDGPRIPTPDVDPADVDPQLRATFWRSVVLANVALMGLALGGMLVVFRGAWKAGGASVAVGLFAAGRLYLTYRAFERRRDDDTGEGDAPTDPGTGGDGPDARVERNA